jgi:hypothetical protein
MQPADKLLLIYTEAATKAIKAIGGTKALKRTPLFGSYERQQAQGERQAA